MTYAMKYFVVVLIAVWGVIQLIPLSLKSDSVSPSLTRFAAAPAHRVIDPYRNAYFYLLGMLAAPSLDPAKVGYEMWVENRESSRANLFDYARAGRSHFRIHPSQANLSAVWETDDPLESIRGRLSPVRDLSSRHQLLLTRYDHCLGMAFEDWGYGIQAMQRFVEPMTLHRLYVADGLSRSTGLGMERMYKELVFWRTVLREAATPASKIMALVVIGDNAMLLSRMVSRPSIDKIILTMGLQLALPLTPSEYSIRWPVQHEVALTLIGHRNLSQQETIEADEEREWLVRTAKLPAQTFKKLAHPVSSSPLLLGGQQHGDLYAVYYEALVRASGPGQQALPRLDEIARATRRGSFDHWLSPTLVEPQWDVLVHQLMETDARLRLTSLQIRLRRYGSTVPVPTRLAEVGSQYFDPFTGLPMLWSPTQQRLYSVGKDRLDDGGDLSFDITVPAVVSTPSSALLPHQASGKRSAS